VKETGIIMSGDHPTKCLDGTKTVTRRTWGLEKINEDPDLWHKPFYDEVTGYWNFWQVNTKEALSVKCPYGGVGDRLWMRETLKEDEKGQWFYSADNELVLVRYKDELAMRAWAHHKELPYCPSLFMPRWASRGLFEIIPGLRPERLQEITKEDARAEGILRFDSDHRDSNGGMGYNRGAPNLPMRYESKAAFMDLWDSINAKRGYGWSVNPWVWVISFKLES